MQNKIDILTLLSYHEQALSNLYKAFSDKFPQEIWKFLISEEIKHSEWILSIMDNVIDDSVVFEPRGFTEENISSSITHLDSIRDSCERGNISELQAFEYAIKFEEGMIEKKFLDSFWSDSSGIQTVFDNLKSETELHREMLKIEYESFKIDKIDIDKQQKLVYEKTAILGLHAEYEQLLSRLYKIFSNKFPDEELWSFMAKEEKKHEAWVKQIILKMIEGTIIYENEDEYQDNIINSLVDLKETIKDIPEKDISEEDALEIAFSIEESMLEKEFFEKFSLDAPLVEQILENLKKDTRKHRDMLDKKIFSQ
ncbi:MAG: hypothetical protein JXR48_08475 [Candidatus Delongbacteria bacterium]|nr:hypothetical protein [Candidatus Delongbacteria bacterium]